MRRSSFALVTPSVIDDDAIEAISSSLTANAWISGVVPLKRTPAKV